jgi:hypothetical protein
VEAYTLGILHDKSAGPIEIADSSRMSSVMPLKLRGPAYATCVVDSSKPWAKWHRVQHQLGDLRSQGIVGLNSRTGFPAIANFREVLAQRDDDLFPAAVHDVAAQFFERNVHDVMVMKLLRRDFVAEV